MAGDASHHKAVRDAGAAEPVKTKNPSDDLPSGKKSRNNAARLRTHLRLGIRQNAVQSGVHIDLLLTKIKGRLFDSLGEELFAGQRIQPCISRPIVLGERLFEHRRRDPHRCCHLPDGAGFSHDAVDELQTQRCTLIRLRIGDHPAAPGLQFEDVFRNRIPRQIFIDEASAGFIHVHVAARIVD